MTPEISFTRLNSYRAVVDIIRLGDRSIWASLETTWIIEYRIGRRVVASGGLPPVRISRTGIKRFVIVSLTGISLFIAPPD